MTSFLTYIKESLIFTLSMIVLPMVATAGLVVGMRFSNVHLMEFMQGIDSLFPFQVGLEALKHIPFWKIPLCGIEDVVFVLPSLLLLKRGHMKTMIVVLTFSAMVFMTGHFYQGFASGVIKIVYPVFALYYANKYGISRTITGHIILDFVAILLIQGVM